MEGEYLDATGSRKEADRRLVVVFRFLFQKKIGKGKKRTGRETVEDEHRGKRKRREKSSARRRLNVARG